MISKVEQNQSSPWPLSLMSNILENQDSQIVCFQGEPWEYIYIYIQVFSTCAYLFYRYMMAPSKQDLGCIGIYYI